MKTGLFYFSGAGNSKAVARMISSHLQAQVCRRMDKASLEDMEGLNSIGLVFPSYFGLPPTYLNRFVDDILAESAGEITYLFVIITHGGGPAYTAAVMEMLLQNTGLTPSYIAGVRMVDTYIPLFRIQDKGTQERMHSKAYERTLSIIEELKSEGIRLPMRWPFSHAAYRLFRRKNHGRYGADRNFTIDERCTQCGLCIKMCPAQNITLGESTIEYHGRCEQCFACYHHCPTHAIGRKRRPLHGYQYYRGPEYFHNREGIET